MIATFRASVYFLLFSFGRQVRSRRVWVALSILALILLVVVLIGLTHTWSAGEFGGNVMLGFVTLFYLPAIGLLFGTAPTAELRDERSLGWIFARPVPRPVVYLGQLLASVPLGLALAVGGFGVLCAAGSHFGRPEVADAFETYVAAVAYGTVAYLALFHLVAALWRHSMLISFAYAFFIEVFVGNIPGFLKKVSVSFYVRSMVFGAGREWLDRPPAAIFDPLSADDARLVLGIVAGVLTALGMWVFSRKEYVDSV